MNSYAPITSKRQQVSDKLDRAVLLEELRKIRRRAMAGEAERRATSRRGAKLAKGRMWEEGITSGRLPISANQAIAQAEQFIASVLRNAPVPELRPINDSDEDAAALLEGAIVTNVKTQRLLEKLQSAMRMAFFSYPQLGYTYWDSEYRRPDGRVIGDFATRMYPSHRAIVDSRHWFVEDMDFAGVRETMSRAKLIRLFPDKADAIEAAMNLDGQEKPGMPGDPWDSPFHQGRPNALSRLVADDQGKFTGKQSIKVGGKMRKQNPLLAEIEAEFLWVKDSTPIEKEEPKLDSTGRPIMHHQRHEDTGELLFDFDGWDTVVDPERGPMFQPKLKPRRTLVMQTNIVKKYPAWRHVAWLPDDGIILWDVRWDGPCPLWPVRTSYPLNDFWDREGQGLRRARHFRLRGTILWTIIFQRLKLSLGGTWLASFRSGLKRQKLTPEDGQVFYGKSIGQDDVRQFPVSPLDVSYVNVLHEIEQEMMKLIGLAPVQRGQAAGRVDASTAYDKLIEQAGTAQQNAAQLLESSLTDYARIAVWYVQNFYTHEHFVEVEDDDGITSFRQASRLATQGEFAIDMDTSAMQAHSDSAMRDVAQEGARLGIYSLPMLAKLGRYPQWRRALKQKMLLIEEGPQGAPLLGPAGAPPGQVARPAQTRRSHHKPGSPAG